MALSLVAVPVDRIVASLARREWRKRKRDRKGCDVSGLRAGRRSASDRILEAATPHGAIANYQVDRGKSNEMEQQVQRTLRLAYLDNTLPKKRLKPGYRRGEHADRLSHLSGRDFDGLTVLPTIIDPLNPPWNPLRYRHSLYAGLDPVRALLQRQQGAESGSEFQKECQPDSVGTVLSGRTSRIGWN